MELFEEGKVGVCVYVSDFSSLQAGELLVYLYNNNPPPVTANNANYARVQDPALYLVPNLALRERPQYHNPVVYGTITGPSLKSSGSGGAGMKDGGMVFGKAKIESGKANEMGKGKEKVKPQEKETMEEVVEKSKVEPKAVEEAKVSCAFLVPKQGEVSMLILC
jgi:hypothetical protein